MKFKKNVFQLKIVIKMQKNWKCRNLKTPDCVQLLANWLVRTLFWIPPVLARSCGKERKRQLGWLVFIGRYLMTSSEHPRTHVSSETFDVITVIYCQRDICFVFGKQTPMIWMLHFYYLILKNNCCKSSPRTFWKHWSVCIQWRRFSFLFSDTFIYSIPFVVLNNKISSYRI